MSSVEKNHVEDRDSEDDGMPDLESVGSSEVRLSDSALSGDVSLL